MRELTSGDRVQFTNLVTGQRMEGKLVGGSEAKYLEVYVEEKKAVFVALTSETIRVGEGATT
jgi:hypothetical protein